MKHGKKRILSLLCACLLLTQLISTGFALEYGSEETTKSTGETASTCTCETLCTADAVSADCPVCSAEGADLSACTGKTAETEITCTCETLCTEGAVNADCPVCSAEGADLTLCKGEDNSATPSNAAGNTVIASWQYNDPDGYLSYDEASGAYVLPLGGAYEDDLSQNPTLAQIVEILPVSITATVDGAEEAQEIELSGWTCADYPEDVTAGIPSGSYTFTATLPEGYALADSAAALTVNVSFGETIAADNTIPTEGGELKSGTYRLTENIMLTTANLTIPTGAEVTIDLNGCTLNGNDSGSVITVSGTLTITDNSTGSTGKITGGKASYDSTTRSGGDGGAVCIQSSGTVTLDSGTLSGNTANRGGAVFVGDGATFTMSGGTITGNSVTHKTRGGNGGGVFVDVGGTFKMEDGSITGNTAEIQGGAVFINSNTTGGVGTMIMSGGTISGNSAEIGGGICVNGKLTMSSGTITGNSVAMTGNSISGEEQISGGGVKVNDGTFTMSGGRITGNTATSSEGYPAMGGGVYVERNDNKTSSTFSVSGSASVTGNKADNADNNVYLPDEQYITLSGTLSGKIGVTTATALTGDTAVEVTTEEDNTAYYSKAYANFVPDASRLVARVNETGKYVELAATTTYTVKFDANGGAGSMADQSIAYDTDTALTANAFTRSGYSFAGWATSESGAVEYADGKTVKNLTTKSSITLYAVWTHTHEWTYSASGATLTATCSGDNSHTASLTISTDATSYTYTGSAQEKATLSDSASWTGYGLTVPTISYSGDTTNVTTAGVTASIAAGSATASVNYTITAATPTIAWASTSQTVTYKGNAAAITPPTVTLVNSETYSGTISYSYKKDGDTEYTSGLPTDAGTYSVKASIAAGGNYTAAETSTDLTLTINAGTMSGISAENVSVTYDGQAHSITVSGAPSDATITYSTDGMTYSATNPGFTNVQAATTVYYKVEKTNYEAVTGSATVEIKPKDLNDDSITVTVSPSKTTVTGETITPTVTVKDGDTVLTEGVDYTLSGDTSASAKGSYTITITGKGNYTGTITAKWKLKAATSNASTDDTSAIALWLALLAASFVGLILVIAPRFGYRGKYSR